MERAYQNLIRQRVHSVDRVFQAIDESKKILSQLEDLGIKTLNEEFPDIGFIAKLTHALRGHVDEILVGLIEARTAPDINNKETEA